MVICCDLLNGKKLKKKHRFFWILRIQEQIEVPKIFGKNMTNPQLTIIDPLLQASFSNRETVTLHPVIKAEAFQFAERTLTLDTFTLLDDPSVKCTPSMKCKKNEIKDFEIYFNTAVPPTYLYEISLYVMGESQKLNHIKTINARRISSQSTFKFLIGAHALCDSRNRNEFTILLIRPSLFAVNDTIIFVTKISRKDIPYIFENKSKMLLPTQITDCSLLFENNTLSNFSIFIEEKEFRVHKEILAAKSPIFLTMFVNEMKEKKENLVNIEDMEADVFREMLRYIYTNNVNDLNVYAESLLRVADKYDMPKLKLLCADELSRSLKIENAIQMLVLADQVNESNLKERTIKFIGSNIKSILETEEYNTWSLSAPPHLLASILRTVTLEQFF